MQARADGCGHAAHRLRQQCSKETRLRLNPTPAAAAFALAFGLAASAQAASVTISCGSVGVDFEFCKKHTDEWAKKTGHTVKLFTQPQSTTDILALFRQMFAAKSADLDIIMVDVVWPGVIKDHLIDLKKYSKGAEKAHFERIVANNTSNGQLLAMPWFTDAGLMYYRKDLLEKYKLTAPTTWEEMAAAAKTIQEGERKGGAADFQGFVFQGKAYEGLTCNGVEWLYSFGGGNIVDDTGKVTVNNPQAVAALTAAKSWIGTIAPTGVLNYAEEEARGVFQKRQGGVHAQLAVRVVIEPRRRQPGERQGGRDAAAQGRRQRQERRHARRLAARGEQVLEEPGCGGRSGDVPGQPSRCRRIARSEVRSIPRSPRCTKTRKCWPPTRSSAACTTCSPTPCRARPRPPGRSTPKSRKRSGTPPAMCSPARPRRKTA